MIIINNKKVFVGDCHNHTAFSGPEGHDHSMRMLPGFINNGFDFLAVTEHFEALKSPVDAHYHYLEDLVAQYRLPLTILQAVEREMGWAHLLCIGPITPDKIGGEPDEAIPRLHDSGVYISLAHPASEPKHMLWDSGLAQRLVLGGKVDAIEVHRGSVDDGPAQLYRQALNQKVRMGITTGGDGHRRDDPRDVRLLVFAENASEKAIVNGIKNCQAVVIGCDGFLCGPQNLCDLLEKEKYREKLQAVEKERHNMRLDLPPAGVNGQQVKCIIHFPAGSKGVIACYPDGDNVRYAVNKREVFLRLPPGREKSVSMITAVRETPFGPLAVAHDINGCQPVEVQLYTNTFNGKAVIVRITNNYETELEAQFEISGELFAEAKKGSLSLGPKETKEASFPVGEAGLPYKGCQTTVSMLNKQLSHISTKRDLSFVSCLQVREAVGLQDLPVAIKCPQGGTISALPGQKVEWKDDDDLSADVRLGWNKKFLFLDFSVKDDFFYNEWQGAHAYLGDSIQFGFDPVLSIKKDYGDVHEFLIAKTPAGDQFLRWHIAWELLGKEKKDGRGSAIAGSSFSIAPFTSGMHYQLSIPWDQLQPFVPEPGKVFGFAFVVNDANEERCRTKWLAWGGDIGNKKDPSNWGTVTLLK